MTTPLRQLWASLALTALLACASGPAPMPTPTPMPTPMPTPTHSPSPTPTPTPTPSPSPAFAPPPLAAGEVLLSTGGDLDLTRLPAATVTRTADRLIAIGQTEVPASSRLQAALALVDAVARAELVTALRSGIASLELDRQAQEAGRATQSIEVITAQAAHGLLPGLAPARHGWQKVRRGGEEVLRLWSRVEAGRAEVEQSVAKALPGEAPEVRARRAVERMANEQRLAAPSR